eukprot:CAMPEP_0119300244 /NCGR_PEP_ID=MMETSP1333-20130426/2218_1 /TAXON_ID=418940 /ORGANISM="Scyphosphaera apsteinii, Strain RCC1455" /LENGTH=476 /DNA_ID=CAMNT_0007301949 /DNA_START=408 /DNA_END=1839 /DNA_ORIENTATION=+
MGRQGWNIDWVFFLYDCKSTPPQWIHAVKALQAQGHAVQLRNMGLSNRMNFRPKLLFQRHLVHFINSSRHSTVWLLDADISLAGFNLSHFLCVRQHAALRWQGGCLSLDQSVPLPPPPVIVQPTILQSTQYYWPFNWRRWNTGEQGWMSPALAAPTPYIEQQAPLLDAAFFFWWIGRLANASRPLWKMQVTYGTDWGADYQWCSAAEQYAQLRCKGGETAECGRQSCLIIGLPINHNASYSIRKVLMKGDYQHYLAATGRVPGYPKTWENVGFKVLRLMEDAFPEWETPGVGRAFGEPMYYYKWLNNSQDDKRHYVPELLAALRWLYSGTCWTDCAAPPQGEGCDTCRRSSQPRASQPRGGADVTRQQHHEREPRPGRGCAHLSPPGSSGPPVALEDNLAKDEHLFDDQPGLSINYINSEAAVIRRPGCNTMWSLRKVRRWQAIRWQAIKQELDRLEREHDDISFIQATRPLAHTP